MHLHGKDKCTFAAFTISETKTYLAKKGLQLYSVVIKRLTYLNPLLLSSIPSNLDEYTIRRYIESWVLTYIRDVLMALIQLDTLKSWVHGKL